MARKYLNRVEVETIQRAIWASDLTQTYIANQLGIDRSYLTKLLNCKVPMAKVYPLAIKMVLLQHRLGKLEKSDPPAPKPDTEPTPTPTEDYENV